VPSGRILVVDDDDLLRDAVSEALRDAGYDVTEARDGKHALDTLRDSRPTLIILDLMMPVMNGWELAEVLRDDPELKTIPVCVLSAVADRAPPQSAATLRKPVALDVLLATVATYSRADD
jgi:CheY-like chemotaxis protein